MVYTATKPADRDARLYPDKPPDSRRPSQRDHDRILHTSAFRRLAEVTQVVQADEGHVFHNRLTHSLEVAQVARRLAEKFIGEKQGISQMLGLDPDVTDSAALAHDLGHPPFGHIAEQELNDLVTKAGLLDGFEGNAQSLRIVTKLALHHPDYPGLNLTRATLNGLLKYPWLRGTGGIQQRKWGAYHSEETELKWARENFSSDDYRKTPEAEVMDWADDVTYAVHDAADFYRAGLVPLDRLSSLKDDSERKRFFDEVFKRLKSEGTPVTDSKPFERAFEGMIVYFPIDENYQGTSDHRASLRFYTAGLIARYVGAIQLNLATVARDRWVRIEPEVENEVFMLKQLTWHYVILNPSLASQQWGQRRIIRDLFEILREAAEQKNLAIFPFATREALAEQEEIKNDKLKPRIIADLISGMTEKQAIRMHSRLTGTSLGSALEDV